MHLPYFKPVWVSSTLLREVRNPRTLESVTTMEWLITHLMDSASNVPDVESVQSELGKAVDSSDPSEAP